MAAAMAVKSAPASSTHLTAGLRADISIGMLSSENPQHGPPSLSIHQLAERLGIHADTVRRRLREGAPHVRTGPKAIRIDFDKFVEWCNERYGSGVGDGLGK